MIPKDKEILSFIESRNNLVNLSMIANHFSIKNNTAADIVDDLVKRKLVDIKKIGSNKMVTVKKNAGR